MDPDVCARVCVCLYVCVKNVFVYIVKCEFHWTNDYQFNMDYDMSQVLPAFVGASHFSIYAQ